MERADLTHHEELNVSASLPSQLPGVPQTTPTRTRQTLGCHQGGVGYLKAKIENMRSFFPKAMWVLNDCYIINNAFTCHCHTDLYVAFYFPGGLYTVDTINCLLQNIKPVSSWPT